MQNEPTRAEAARTLIISRSTGVLATNSKRREGYPFASMVPYALDSTNSPLFLMSRLAVHSKNIQHDPRVSLLIWAEGAELDPFTSPRVVLMGEIKSAPDELTATYLAQHPDAEQWAGFGDFALYRLEVQDVYYIGGFGAMGWVSPGDIVT